MLKKRKWLGFDRRQVDRYLKQLTAEYHSALEQLMVDVEGLANEEALVLSEIDRLEAQTAEASRRQPVVAHAQASLRHVLQSIEQTAAAELTEIDRQMHEQELLRSQTQRRVIEQQEQLRQQIAQLTRGLQDMDIHTKSPQSARLDQTSQRPFEQRPHLQLVGQAIAVSLFDRQTTDQVAAEYMNMNSAFCSNDMIAVADSKDSFWGEPIHLDRWTTAELETATTPPSEPVAISHPGQSEPLPPRTEIEDLPSNAQLDIRDPYRYIVGKIAGEDLFTEQGEVLIKKQQTITVEVIQRAEREGKLAELIVHMLLPGMDGPSS